MLRVRGGASLDNKWPWCPRSGTETRVQRRSVFLVLLLCVEMELGHLAVNEVHG